MAQSTEVKNKFSPGSLAIADGSTPTPLTHTVQYDNADLKLTGARPGGKGHTHYFSRGARTSTRPTEPVYPQVTFTLQWTEWTAAIGGTALDMLFATTSSAYAARVSTLGSTAGFVPAFTLTYTSTGAVYGESDKVMVCNDAIPTACDFSEEDPNTVSLTFEVIGGITVDGETLLAAV